MRKTEDDESKKLDVFSWRNRKNRLNPFLSIEKYSHDQLEELKAIRTLLEKQIEQADESADAAERATKDKDKGVPNTAGGVSESSLAKLLKKGSGGDWKGGLAEMLLELSGAGSILMKLKSLAGGLISGLKGFIGSLINGVKSIASKIGNLFKGGGEAAEAAEGAEAVEGGAAVAEGGAAVGEGAAVAGGATLAGEGAVAAGGAAAVAGTGLGATAALAAGPGLILGGGLAATAREKGSRQSNIWW